MAKKTTAVAVQPAKNDKAVGRVIDTDEELLRYAQRGQKIAEAAGSTGAWLTFKGGVLKFRNADLKDNECEMVILDAVLENQFYKDAFDPDTPANPVCVAYAAAAACSCSPRAAYGVCGPRSFSTCAVYA